MQKIKDNIVVFLTIVFGILILLVKHLYGQITKQKVRISRAEDNFAAEKEKANINNLLTEAKNAEERRKEIVKAYRDNEPS